MPHYATFLYGMAAGAVLMWAILEVGGHLISAH